MAVIVPTVALPPPTPSTDQVAAPPPAMVAVNCFDDARRYPLETMRAALNLTPDVPLVLCDARQRGSSRDALVALVEHAVTRISKGEQFASAR